MRPRSQLDLREVRRLKRTGAVGLSTERQLQPAQAPFGAFALNASVDA
jgi:hypothetical protein